MFVNTLLTFYVLKHVICARAEFELETKSKNIKEPSKNRNCLQSQMYSDWTFTYINESERSRSSRRAEQDSGRACNRAVSDKTIRAKNWSWHTPKKRRVPWTRSYKLYQQSHSARLYSSVFQFKHCTHVPARKQNNVACCFIEQTKCARLKTSAFQPLTQYLNDVVWRSKLIHIHIKWLQNKPGFYSLDERFPMK